MPLWKKKKGDEERDPRDPFWNMFEEFDVDIDRMREMMDEMMKSMFAEGSPFRREDLFKNIKPGKPMVYGFSIKIGPQGKPSIEQFGNIEPERRMVKKEREPLVDVIEKAKIITVLAELPGVNKKDIKINLSQGNKVLIVDVPDKFYKEIKLPVKVKSKLGEAHHKNGVLEIELTKAKIGLKKGPKIPVK